MHLLPKRGEWILVAFGKHGLESLEVKAMLSLVNGLHLNRSTYSKRLPSSSSFNV